MLKLFFSTPSYAILTSANSAILPACFVLKLAKKMPMCLELLHKIQKVTELECGDVSACHPLLSMIVQHTSNGQLDCQNNRGLYVVNIIILTNLDFFFINFKNSISIFFSRYQTNIIAIL